MCVYMWYKEWYVVLDILKQTYGNNTGNRCQTYNYCMYGTYSRYCYDDYNSYTYTHTHTHIQTHTHTRIGPARAAAWVPAKGSQTRTLSCDENQR